jgi:arylsulfatase A-like enzyme
MWLPFILACTNRPVGPAGSTPPVDSGVAPTTPGLALRFTGPPPTNLVMISVDTFRRDHAGAYDDGPSLTPFLDARMAEAVTLDDATGCANWTVPGTACVLAGASNLDRAEARGMVPILVGQPLEPIPTASDPNGPTPLLPSFLRAHGFSSLLVSANGFFSKAWGNAQGYDTLLYPGPVTTRALWDLAEAELAASPMPEPWLVHLHAFEPHAPYLPGEQYLAALETLPPIPFDLSTIAGQEEAINALYADPPVLSDETAEAVKDHVRAWYAGEITRFDDGLAAVWGEMDAAGLLDDALVVFWSDHGEALFDQVVNEHGKLLFRNENDVVAWFWAKNLEPLAWGGPTEQIDVAPSIFAALGLPIPPEMTGIPVGLAPADRVRHAFTDAYKGPITAVRQGSWKMQFRWATSEEAPQNLSLYDLATDPDEQQNLYDPAAPSPEALALWPYLRDDVVKAEPWVAADPRGWVVSWPPELPR